MKINAHYVWKRIVENKHLYNEKYVQIYFIFLTKYTHISVSYTHLDVYKRQRRERVREREGVRKRDAADY